LSPLSTFSRASPSDAPAAPYNARPCTTVAVTQNFCSRRTFAAVWRELRASGYDDTRAAAWLAALERREPSLARAARALNAADGYIMPDVMPCATQPPPQAQTAATTTAAAAGLGASARASAAGADPADRPVEGVTSEPSPLALSVGA